MHINTDSVGKEQDSGIKSCGICIKKKVEHIGWNEISEPICNQPKIFFLAFYYLCKLASYKKKNLIIDVASCEVTIRTVNNDHPTEVQDLA